MEDQTSKALSPDSEPQSLQRLATTIDQALSDIIEILKYRIAPCPSITNYNVVDLLDASRQHGLLSECITQAQLMFSPGHEQYPEQLNALQAQAEVVIERQITVLLSFKGSLESILVDLTSPPSDT